MESVFEGDSGHSQGCPCDCGHHHNRVREVSKFWLKSRRFFWTHFRNKIILDALRIIYLHWLFFFFGRERRGGYTIDFPRRSAETAAGLCAEKKRPQLCVRPVVVCSWSSVRIREKCSRVVCNLPNRLWNICYFEIVSSLLKGVCRNISNAEIQLKRLPITYKCDQMSTNVN